MADPKEWVEIVVASGVIGLVAKASGRLWKRLIDRPLIKAENALTEAEERARYWEGKAHELAGEIKGAAATATSLRRMLERDAGHNPSVPPPPDHPREELPTLIAVSDLRREAAFALAEEAERSRQRPLNRPEGRLPAPRAPLPLEGLGGRQDYEDHRRRNAQHGVDTPVEFRKRMPTLRDQEVTAPGGWDEEDGGFVAENEPLPPKGKR